MEHRRNFNAYPSSAFKASYQNSQDIGDLKRNSLGEISIKKMRFPYDVFSSNLTGLRKAPPPALRTTKKRLQIVTNREEIIQRLNIGLDGESKNYKVCSLYKIDPLILYNHRSVKNIPPSYKPHLPNHNGPSTQSDNQPPSAIQRNRKVLLKPLVEHDNMKDKWINTDNEIVKKKTWSLILITGTKRLKYTKDKIKKAKNSDKIEEEPSVNNITFGK